MAIFQRTGVVPDFVTTTSSFVIGDEVRGKVTIWINGKAKAGHI
jgi:hypothetical protein